jgi:hypothetical protein
MVYEKRKESRFPSPLEERMIDKLLKLEGLGDDQKTKLLPQVNFIIGAGVLYNLINLDFLKVPLEIVSRRTTSPEGTIDVCLADALSL